MDNTENMDLEGTREKCIYTIDTFVNEDGFKVEEHTPVNPKGGPPQFYGFYLVNTDIGPIDRYFRFEKQTLLEDCFDEFRTLAESDAELLANAMKEESKIIEAQEAEKRQADAESQAMRAAPAPVSEEPSPVNAQLLDENGYPAT
mgnify:CR=1 FL=1